MIKDLSCTKKQVERITSRTYSSSGARVFVNKVTRSVTVVVPVLYETTLVQLVSYCQKNELVFYVSPALYDDIERMRVHFVMY